MTLTSCTPDLTGTVATTNACVVIYMLLIALATVVTLFAKPKRRHDAMAVLKLLWPWHKDR